jgi:hypothetical protein
MPKPDWVLFGLNLMVTTIVPTFLSFPVSAAAVQVSQAPGSHSSHHQATSLETFLQTFSQRRRQREGIRRSGLCVLSPSVLETDVIWSDRPLFIWRGSAHQIILTQLGNSEKLWSQTVEPENQQVRYDGVALQPGEIYQWELLGEAGTQTSLIFQVMEEAQRSQVEAQLQTVAMPLKASGATEEAIAIQQAQYFADQNLWSDALQLLYSVNNPSPQIGQAIQQIEETLCGS